MVNDPIVEEVCQMRNAIEAACDNDPVKYPERTQRKTLVLAFGRHLAEVPASVTG